MRIWIDCTVTQKWMYNTLCFQKGWRAIQGIRMCVFVLAWRLHYPRLHAPLSIHHVDWQFWSDLVFCEFLDFFFVWNFHLFLKDKTRGLAPSAALQERRCKRSRARRAYTWVRSHTRRGKMLTDQYFVSSDPCHVMTLWPDVQSHTHTQTHIPLQRWN